MKLIKSAVRPDQLDTVQAALEALHISGITVSEVRSAGEGTGPVAMYRGQALDLDLRPRTEIEVVVADDVVEDAVRTLIAAGRSGEVGDGQVCVLPVSESYWIRTGAREF